MIEWKLSPDGMEWTAGADDLYLSVFDTGDRIMWDVGVSMRRRSTSEGRAASFDEGKAKAETFAREWVAKQAAALGDGWVSVGERLPENDGWYHVAVHDYKGRYPRHAVAEFTRDRFWIADDDGEGDSVFAWRQPALPPLPVAEVKE